MTVELKDQADFNKYHWNFQFKPPELNEEEKNLFDKYVKPTEWEQRREISDQLRESLEKRGQKYTGINRRTQKLNPIPAETGVYKVTLTVNGASLTKSLTVRPDPLFD